MFCKCTSDNAKSVEHTIPESLGNIRHILPKGSICDRCNNYLARKVELPVLSHRSFRNMRSLNGIASKRRRIPSLLAVQLGSGFEVGIQPARNGDINVSAEKQSQLKEILEQANFDEARGFHAFAVNLEIDPPQREMSRLLAKIALERCFMELIATNTTDLIFSSYFDNVRRWARHGDNFSSWPYYQRYIYPQETLMRHPQTGEWVKAGIGQGLFHTPSSETYLSVCFYGTEFSINVGGPNINGLDRWLANNSGASPYLTFGKLRLATREIRGNTCHFLERADTAGEI